MPENKWIVPIAIGGALGIIVYLARKSTVSAEPAQTMPYGWGSFQNGGNNLVPANTTPPINLVPLPAPIFSPPPDATDPGQIINPPQPVLPPYDPWGGFGKPPPISPTPGQGWTIESIPVIEKPVVSFRPIRPGTVSQVIQPIKRSTEI